MFGVVSSKVGAHLVCIMGSEVTLVVLTQFERNLNGIEEHTIKIRNYQDIWGEFGQQNFEYK